MYFNKNVSKVNIQRYEQTRREGEKKNKSRRMGDRRWGELERKRDEQVFEKQKELKLTRKL